MKICIVTPNVVRGDGQGRANYEIVQEAMRRGHLVTVVARRLAPELQRTQLLHWIPIEVNAWPTELLREIMFAWHSSRWLRHHRQQFDLVQTYGAVTWAEADVNTVQFVHSGWLRSPSHIARVRRDWYGAYQWLYTVLNAHWEKKALHQAKVVIAVSDQIKSELITIIGISPTQIRVILNGVDVAEFIPGKLERAPLGLPEAVPLALFVGDIRTNRKNLDTVLHALMQVPALHLAVVGTLDGSPYPQLARDLNLGERIHFLGYRLDIPDIMKAVDFFVFPSRYEPFGMVVSEAMATGLPVITATTTGASEIVTSDCGVVLADAEAIPALVEALGMLATHADQRERMGQVGRTIAEQHSWLSKAKDYVDLFEQMSHPCRSL